MKEIDTVMRSMKQCLKKNRDKCIYCPMHEYGDSCRSALLEMTQRVLKDEMWYRADNIKPNNCGDVLVCCNGTVMNSEIGTIKLHRATERGYWDTGEWHLTDYEDHKVEKLQVIAWREIPVYE